MFKALRNLLNRWFGVPVDVESKNSNTALYAKQAIIDTVSGHADIQPTSHVVPYDETLLERARTQWQFGDWESLAKLDSDIFQHHSDRAKLALLAGAGRLQIGQVVEARQYIQLAQDWGVGKKLLVRVLAAGVHDSLGRAAAIAGQQSRALQHFQSAVATGTPGGETPLLVQARTHQQYQQLGLSLTPVQVALLQKHSDGK